MSMEILMIHQQGNDIFWIGIAATRILARTGNTYALFIPIKSIFIAYSENVFSGVMLFDGPARIGTNQLVCHVFPPNASVLN